MQKLTAIFFVFALFCFSAVLTAYAEPPAPISAEKAVMMGYVEDYFMNNARDITMRKSQSWGDVQTDDKGNRTIRYQFEALIWDKDRFICAANFTFDKEGKFVDMKHADGFPQPVTPVKKPDVSTDEGLKQLVEQFFKSNFRDITMRKSPVWGEAKTDEKGSRTIRYQCEALIWDKDHVFIAWDFTFDKEGEFVDAKKVSGFPYPFEKPDLSTDEGVKRQVERYFSRNYRDLTARKTIQWGERKQEEGGNVSITYRYEATSWHTDKLAIEERFVFDKSGECIKTEEIECKKLSTVKDEAAAASADKMLTLFLDGKFADAAALGNEKFAASPCAEILKQASESLRDQFGGFEKRVTEKMPLGFAKTENGEEFLCYEPVCRCKKADITFRIAIDKDKKIAGFFCVNVNFDKIDASALAP